MKNNTNLTRRRFLAARAAQRRPCSCRAPDPTQGGKRDKSDDWLWRHMLTGRCPGNILGMVDNQPMSSRDPSE